MLIKILLTVIFLAITVGVGFYSRRSAKNVDGFVLGGRNVGGWLTAFECRWLADSLRLWHIIFLCSSLRWLCRTVWLEIWHVRIMDRRW